MVEKKLSVTVRERRENRKRICNQIVNIVFIIQSFITKENFQCFRFLTVVENISRILLKEIRWRQIVIWFMIVNRKKMLREKVENLVNNIEIEFRKYQVQRQIFSLTCVNRLRSLFVQLSSPLSLVSRISCTLIPQFLLYHLQSYRFSWAGVILKLVQ